MQHRSLPQACTRVVAGMFIGVLMVAASGTFADAFADEVSSFNQNAAFSTPTSFSGAGSSFLIPSVSSSSSSSNASGASTSPSSSPSSSDTPSSTGGARSFLSGVAGKAGDVVVGALNLIGVRYRWGGSSPDSGLDCSGFVRYVFQDTLGLALPRRAEEMSRVGEKVRVADLKPGDLVFFNTMRRTFSHVGIYIGDNKFVHSPSTGSTIRVDDMDDAYWEKRFTGARRVETSFSPEQQQDLRQRVSATIGGGN